MKSILTIIAAGSLMMVSANSFAANSSENSMKSSADSIEKSSGKSSGKKVTFRPCGEDCNQRLIDAKPIAAKLTMGIALSNVEKAALSSVINEQVILNPELADFDAKVIAYEISLIQE